jgi:hypothetical protein
MPRREVVGAVEHDVGATNELRKIPGAKPLLQRHDRHFGIDRGERLARRLDLRPADRVGAVEDLPLEIGEVDLVAVGEGQAAEPGSGEIERSRAAEAARADDQRRGRAQLLLALDAELGEEDVTAVAEKLLVVQ